MALALLLEICAVNVVVEEMPVLMMIKVVPWLALMQWAARIIGVGLESVEIMIQQILFINLKQIPCAVLVVLDKFQTWVHTVQQRMLK